jgi:hypothetical protein
MSASTLWAHHGGDGPVPRQQSPRSVEEYRRPPSSGHHHPQIPRPQPHQGGQFIDSGEVHGSPIWSSTDWANHEGNGLVPRPHPPRFRGDLPPRQTHQGRHSTGGGEVHGSHLFESTPSWLQHEGIAPVARQQTPRSVGDFCRPPRSCPHQPQTGLPPPQLHQWWHSIDGGEVHGSLMYVATQRANHEGNRPEHMFPSMPWPHDKGIAPVPRQQTPHAFGDFRSPPGPSSTSLKRSYTRQKYTRAGPS